MASLRYPGHTVDRYVLPMLSFVLNEFLKQELPLEDFPHQLVNCDSAEAFVRRFESLVVPLYLWRAPKADILFLKHACSILRLSSNPASLWFMEEPSSSP